MISQVFSHIPPEVTALASKITFSLGRLIFSMVLGLFVANLLESLRWTKYMEKLASPLIRLGHLRPIAGASFSLAFISPSASNALLSEAYTEKKLTKKELILANLFNSTPTFLVHLPTLFFLLFAFLGSAAFIYLGLTLAAALMRTGATIIVGRIILPPHDENTAKNTYTEEPFSWKEAIRKSLLRSKKRLIKLISYTVPSYIGIAIIQALGWFKIIEQWLAGITGGVSFIQPEAFSIIALYLMAESNVALSAAASLAHANALTTHEIITALLVGNILSSPMRSIRHQFPSYAGYFNPSLAATLVLSNQTSRALSLIIVTIFYLWWI